MTDQPKSPVVVVYDDGSVNITPGITSGAMRQIAQMLLQAADGLRWPAPQNGAGPVAQPQPQEPTAAAVG